MKDKIKIVFKDSQDNEWPTFTQALIATTLLESDVYLERYKLQQIVETLADNLYIREKKNEAK